MKRRLRDEKAKSQIVIKGLRRWPGSEICNHYQIDQPQHYKWRDQFLANPDIVPRTLSSGVLLSGPENQHILPQ
jgi:hypothetical protein